MELSWFSCFVVVTKLYRIKEDVSTAFLDKVKLRHSLGRPSRSDFVQSEFVEVNNENRSYSGELAGREK